MHPLYTFITAFTPMYTRYTCIYTIYTPLNTSKHPLYTLYTPDIQPTPLHDRYDENKGNDSDSSEEEHSDGQAKYHPKAVRLEDEQCYRYFSEPGTLKGHSPYCFKEVSLSK